MIDGRSPTAMRGLFVVRVTDAGAEPERVMVITAASPDDAEFIARLRAAADGLRMPRIERITRSSGAEI